MEYIDRVMQTVIDRNPNEPEFHQAVREVLSSLKPVIEKHPEYEKNAILERIVEPAQSTRAEPRTAIIGRYT